MNLYVRYIATEVAKAIVLASMGVLIRELARQLQGRFGEFEEYH